AQRLRRENLCLPGAGVVRRRHRANVAGEEPRLRLVDLQATRRNRRDDEKGGARGLGGYVAQGAAGAARQMEEGRTDPRCLSGYARTQEGRGYERVLGPAFRSDQASG